MSSKLSIGFLNDISNELQEKELMAVTTLLEHMPGIDARIIATVCTSWFKYVETQK